MRGDTKYKRLIAAAEKLEAAAKIKRCQANEIFGMRLFYIVRADLGKTITQHDDNRRAERLLALGNVLRCVRFYVTQDAEKKKEVERLLQIPGVSPHRRQYGNPEVKAIMEERGVTRQRAYQIIKARKLKENK